MRSEQGVHPIFPGVETVLSTARRPGVLVLLGVQYCLRGDQADGDRVPGQPWGECHPFLYSRVSATSRVCAGSGWLVRGTWK